MLEKTNTQPFLTNSFCSKIYAKKNLIIIEYMVGRDLKDYFLAKPWSTQAGPAPCPAKS